ncbi:MAG: GH92 family glycosyl hydrolase [Bacteroidales bacterium]|jgi:predicted alpha-1,2-mannosidase|nr:GH92 family glycosyl hydrolase [Bacteroidales bacterium]
MRKKIFILVVFALFGSAAWAQQAPVNYVNPFVGTDFHGHTFPGALVPFGGVQVSPDTRLDGWDGCSAYHYSDSLLYGFSHTHLSGTGCSDYGDVLLMPFTGMPSVINSEYAQPFSHADETAAPGYYAVWLPKIKIRAELTASERVGVHRYTFPAGKKARGVILDLQHRDKVLYSKIIYDKKQAKISGVRNSSAWNTHQKLSFSILFSQPIEKVEFYLDDKLTPAANSEIEGENCKAIIYFAENCRNVILKVAVSGIDNYEYAEKNQAEIKGFNFEKIKQHAQQCWNYELSKIGVEGGTEEQKRIFYTALYHCFTSPYIFNNIDGSYMGMDGKIHKSHDHNIYTVFSLWDTYRALHPLLALIDRARTRDFVYTFMRHYEQGGMLTVWELSAFETWCMIGYHSVSVIYDACRKGILDDYTQAEKEKILKAMIYSANLPKLGRLEYARYGFIPADKEHESVSKTLEYAYDDWCIAQFAKAIGNQQAYDEFIYRCQFYKNLMDSAGFMHPIINGSFMQPFAPTEINNHFTEGNSWQYSTYVPHDFTNYIALMGSKAQAERFLDSLFHTQAATTGRNQADVTGLIGQYAHGNEPSHHAAYLYNYAGKPYKTQQLVRQIMQELYTSKPDGLCGNEDCGQMSAWYVFSAMGFYPVCPGDNQYIIGSPIFDKATMRLENGKTFTVICENQSPENYYIKEATLNGTPLNRSYITYDDIKNGGVLKFNMSNKPASWATEPESCPKSEVEPTLLTSPVFEPALHTFKDSLYVSLSVNEANKLGNDAPYFIYYTLDGSFPNQKSLRYEQPVLIKENTEIQAVTYQLGRGRSQLASSQYYKFEKNRDIALKSKYNAQYTADGPDGLIDNLRGSVNWRLGGWQGYQDTDFEAVIDLRKVQDVEQIGAGFLQDTRSWILFPKNMTVEISDDNEHYVNYGIFANPYPDSDETPATSDFMITKKAKARYIRIKAENYGDLPAWHAGAGYPAFIFIDEVLVK